ncbi:MAG: PEP-CTERM sorting domain-containing protein [Sulfuritalea sp.]|nr:PEP-CTERM sorting domain-containing protein [Sulfuritalea sp.]
MIALATFLISISSPVWATSFNMGVVNPVASQLVPYPEQQPGQALLSDTFNFTIANGDWVTVDFQGMPQPGEGYSSVEFFLRDTLTFANLAMWAGYETPGWGTSFFSTETITGLTAGTAYQVVMYGWGDPMSSATGKYELTLTAQSSLAPVPEPEAYAMMLAGLGLLGVMVRRRKLKLNA